jgi:uncharacterized membrane protein YczE|tara:strand:+ start:133 stop:807 length:675 start_codon:yes stop_codon:yes gene_type:complete
MALNLRFLQVKGIPVLFWSSPKALTIKPPFMSFVLLIIGLAIFGLGEALLISAGYGVSPWTVFAQGLTTVTGWSIGFATFITSIAVLVLWVPLRQMPGIGTISNAIVIALVLEYILPHLPRFELDALQIAQAVFGVLVTGFGGAIYLISNLGPGPRDGLMTGVQHLTNWPISGVRASIEILVVIAGWSLGGTVGLGTVLFAIGIGPAVSASLFALNHFFRDTKL